VSFCETIAEHDQVSLTRIEQANEVTYNHCEALEIKEVGPTF